MDCDLLQHGLLRGSFVPPSPIRQLRDLTRTRASLRQDHTAVANRMQKILEDANIKLASVATDWLGVSGRIILSRMLDGEQDVGKLADLCRGRLRDKMAEMQLALEGGMTEHHRWMLRLQREQLEFLETQIAKLDARIQQKMLVNQEAVDLCTTIPGIDPEVGRTYKQGDYPRCVSHLESHSPYSRGLVLCSACFRNAAWHAHGTKVFEGSARRPELLGMGRCAESLTTDICHFSELLQNNKLFVPCICLRHCASLKV